MSAFIRRYPLNAAVQRYFDLLNILVIRNLKVRYRGSILGVYWSLLNPILMTLVYTTILGSLFTHYYNGNRIAYGLAVFCGMVAINFFGTSTSMALPSVVSNGTLLNKISLPMSIFPVSTVLASVFQLTIGAFPLLVIVTLLISHSILNALLLIVPLTALILFSTGVAFLVSMAYVFFRDIPYLYEIVVFIMWVTSPVFYPLSAMQPHIQRILWFNPLTSIIEGLRQLVLSSALPDFRVIGQSLLLSAIIAFLGWSLFRQYRDDFMDLL